MCRYIYSVDPQGYFGLNKSTPIDRPPAAVEFDVASVSSTGVSFFCVISSFFYKMMLVACLHAQHLMVSHGVFVRC